MPSQYIPASVYNTTNGSGFVEVAKLVNDYTNGLFWITMLACFFVILFFSMNKFGVRQAIASSSFITFIVTVFFKLTGLVSDTQFFGMLLVLCLVVLYLVASMNE